LWGTVAGILMQVWIWGSLVVLLVNQRRRAVHDFLDRHRGGQCRACAGLRDCTICAISRRLGNKAQ
jgi:hypothetical protein